MRGISKPKPPRNVSPRKETTPPKTSRRKAAPGANTTAPTAPHPPEPDKLFDRIVSILEEARGRTVRAVNTEAVTAYWHIGREIVQAFQGGDLRAEYGASLLEGLSRRLTERYGKGFSSTNLWYFRQFYLAYPNRRPAPNILHPSGGESMGLAKSHPPVGESADEERGFHPALSWSHYRALMRVDNPGARDFYEEEAVACGWSKLALERQIETLSYERLLVSRDRKGMLAQARKAGSA